LARKATSTFTVCCFLITGRWIRLCAPAYPSLRDSGTAIAVKHLLPQCMVIAAEPAGADDAFRSFHAKKRLPSENPKTIADGLLTSLGKRNFAIILDKADDIVTVSEQKITEAMRLVWERMKIIIEPSSAVPLAAILEKKLDITRKKVGIILSGGNLDLDKFFT